MTDSEEHLQFLVQFYGKYWGRYCIGETEISWNATGRLSSIFNYLFFLRGRGRTTIALKIEFTVFCFLIQPVYRKNTPFWRKQSRLMTEFPQMILIGWYLHHCGVTSVLGNFLAQSQTSLGRGKILFMYVELDFFSSFRCQSFSN